MNRLGNPYLFGLAALACVAIAVGSSRSWRTTTQSPTPQQLESAQVTEKKTLDVKFVNSVSRQLDLKFSDAEQVSRAVVDSTTQPYYNRSGGVEFITVKTSEGQILTLIAKADKEGNLSYSLRALVEDQLKALPSAEADQVSKKMETLLKQAREKASTQS